MLPRLTPGVPKAWACSEREAYPLISGPYEPVRLEFGRSSTSQKRVRRFYWIMNDEGDDSYGDHNDT